MKVKIVWSTCGEVIVEMPDEDFGLLTDPTSKFSAPCDLDDLPEHIAEKVRDQINSTLYDSPVEIDNVELVVERKHVGSI